MFRFSLSFLFIFIISSANSIPLNEGIITRTSRYFLGPALQYAITCGAPKRTKGIECRFETITDIYCRKTKGALEIATYRPNIQDPHTAVAILYFGGNAQDPIEERKRLKEISDKAKLRVYTVNYPGYGGSDGGRWFSKTIDNSIAAADSLVEGLKLIGFDTFIPTGWSFGAAIAAKVAQNHKTPLLALYSPFFSARDAVKHVTSQLSPTVIQNYIIDPLTDIALPESTLNNGEVLKNITHDMDVVIAHGKADKVINYQDSERLNRIMENNENIHQTFHPISYGDHTSPLTDDTTTDLFIQRVKTKLAEIPTNY